MNEARSVDGADKDEEESSMDQIFECQEELLERMGLDLSLTVEFSEDSVEVRMEGSDRDMVLQDKAELLDVFQYLLNRIFARKLKGSKVVAYCDGFRKKKKEELKQIAKHVVEKVKRTGMTQEIEMMNPYERRIIHLVVAEEDRVKSESIGDSFKKRMMIIPA